MNIKGKGKRGTDMFIIIWLIAVIYFTNRIKHELIKLDKESIQKTTYTEEIVVDGERKEVTKDKCPNCGNTTLRYVDAEKTEKAGFRLAVCGFCGKRFKAMREPSSINGIFAFVFSLVACSLVALVVKILMVLI